MKNMTSLACTRVMVLASNAFAQPGADPAAPQGMPAPTPQGVPATAPMPPPTGPVGVCVVIDPSRDTLAEQDRVAARSLLMQAFETEQFATDASGTACTETYAVSNIKLGNTISVTITGPRGQRTGRATSLDDLPNVYSQMVKSLITGAPIATGTGVVDRTNVTKEQSAPRRVQADNMKYVQLGYGAITARGQAATGPAFAVGYRKELDRVAIDGSLAFLLGNDTDLNDGVTLAIPKLVVLWNQTPIADATVYYGFGVSYGFSWVGRGDIGGGADYTGSGMQAHIVAGYAMLRSSTIRLFLQLDTTLPLYKSVASATDTGWSPSAMFTLGFGWGKTTQVVRVINE